MRFVGFFSSFGMGANVFAADPQYFDEGLPGQHPPPTEEVAGSGVCVAALGDHALEVELPEETLKRRGFSDSLVGTAFSYGELILNGPVQLQRLLSAEAVSAKFRVLLVATRCSERTRGA